MPTARFICAIDQGTTGTTVLILDEALKVHARVNQEFEQLFPKPGWVEHDPEAIWQATTGTLERAIAIAQITPAQVAAVAITNQRETSVLWERHSGKPIHNAIVWQDRRTSQTMAALKEAGHQDEVQQRTGLLLDPYFSGSKVQWMLEHVQGARKKAQAGSLAFGTIDTFLLWRLTKGAVHKTDISNASRTLFMNLDAGQWDDQMLALFDVPSALLPQIVGNAEVYGHTKGVPGLLDGTPICGMAGDQQAALFGQACFDPGEAKCTYGTGAFLLMNTGERRPHSQHNLLATAAWRLGQKTTYALEGSAFIAGALVQWLRDGLKLFEHASEIEALAAQVEDSGGVVLVPSFVGLGAPHWQPEARGVLWGMTRGTTKAHIARAALDAIALQNVDLLGAMEADANQALRALKVDGGASENNLLMQLQADLVGRTIVRPAMTDTTALGCAMMAGLALGMFTDLKEIRDTWQSDAQFLPQMEDTRRQEMLALWREGLARV